MTLNRPNEYYAKLKQTNNKRIFFLSYIKEESERKTGDTIKKRKQTAKQVFCIKLKI